MISRKFLLYYYSSFFPRTNSNPAKMPLLFQGEAFSEFIEEYDGVQQQQPNVIDSIRIINQQSELIVENLNEMKNTVKDRRQSIAFLLEQCILLSASLPTAQPKDKALFRRIRRHVEKARRITRGDNL
jgi:hypothetical protein